MHTVFVYGSLRKGFGNHRLITASPKSEFVAVDYLKGYLYDVGRFPFFVYDENGIDVTGEIYTVDDDTMYSLDLLEGYTPGQYHNFYNRKIAITTNNRRVYYYEAGHDLCSGDWPLVDGGDWVKHYGITTNRQI